MAKKLFDPAKVAYYEAEGWRTYYKHNWLKLLWLVLRICQEQFGIPFFQAVRAAYYISLASAEWVKPNHDREKVREWHVKFYRIARRYSGLQFAPEKVAELEERYWEVHRRLVGKPDKTEFIEIMVQLHGEVFGLTPEQARESAELRVQANITLDLITGKKSQDEAADWAKLTRELEECYKSIVRESERKPAAPSKTPVWPDGWQRRSRYAIRDHILTLDPEKDHQQIAFLDTCYDFPFDTTRSLELAMLRTFCEPSMAAILEGTGEFTERPQKRYDDTVLILSEMLEWGYDSERGRTAQRRMNQMHGRYPIPNEAFLYVLSTFIFEPIRWNDRFGWRELTETEKLASFYYWQEVGRRMNIKNIPESYAELERFNIEYEKQFFRYSDSNRRVADATVDVYASWFPALLRPLVRKFVYAMQDDIVLDAFKFPHPSPFMRRSVKAMVKSRGLFLRMMPPRRFPRLLTQQRARTYPKGYRVEQLGALPPKPETEREKVGVEK